MLEPSESKFLVGKLVLEMPYVCTMGPRVWHVGGLRILALKAHPVEDLFNKMLRKIIHPAGS